MLTISSDALTGVCSMRGIDMAKDKKLDAKTAWEKYHKLRAKADAALKKLADFSYWELGRGHLADGFTDDMDENYLILEEVLYEEFGPDPEAEDEDDDEDYDE